MNPSQEIMEPFGPLAICYKNATSRVLRRKREFIPEEKKDTVYWEKRQKNNESAKRSREKRQFSYFAIESQMAALQEENFHLRWELQDLKARCGLLNHIPEQPNDSVNSLFCTQGNCWSRAQGTIPSAERLLDYTWIPREHLDSNPKHMSFLKQCNMVLSQGKNNPTFSSSAFLPTYFNCQLIQRYSHHFPIYDRSHFPVKLPNTGEVGKEGPQNNDSEKETMSDVPVYPMMPPNYSALPHKLRIKTKKHQPL